MPKIFEYLGYAFLIYTDDQPPIHVHVQHGEHQAKAELIYEDNSLTVRFSKIRGVKLLTAKQQKEANTFIETYQKDIVDKWTQIHVYRTTVKTEKITRKI